MTHLLAASVAKASWFFLFCCASCWRPPVARAARNVLVRCEKPIEESAWWTAHKAFYSSLFKGTSVQSDEHGAEGGTLSCRWRSMESLCMQKLEVNGRYEVLSTRQKANDVTVLCGVDGEWLEPSAVDTQSCAYPLSPRSVGSDQGLMSALPSKEDNRVLTALDKQRNAQLEVRHYDRYDAKQLWIIDGHGVIRSAWDANYCLTPIDKRTWTGATGWMESYLFLAKCNVGSISQDQIWRLGSELAAPLRKSGGGRRCAEDRQCCSLSFKKWDSKTGNYLLTFPRAEGLVSDWATTEYLWDRDGTVYTEEEVDGEHEIEKEFKKKVEGKRSDGKGGIVKAPQDRVRVQEDFYLQPDPHPKVLKNSKMSGKDMELSVVDFWMS